MAPRITTSSPVGDEKVAGGGSSEAFASSTRQRVPLPPQQHVKGRRVKMATHEELACPDIAWPTLIFAAVTLTAYLSVPLLTWRHPTLWTVPLTSVAIYANFTAMHEAAHRAVSAKHRWLNEALGHVTAMVVFHSPFKAFRYIHLEHHKYTNDPEKDPDHWSAGFGPWWLQPCFWVTQLLHYYYHYFRRVFQGQRPLEEVVECVAIASLSLLCAGLGVASGYGRHYLVFVLLPRMATDTFLAYSFDYAPHHPHATPRSTDIYACTSMIGGLLDPADGVDLTYPLIYQNYHNIHHLYPTVPFYKYPALWLNHRKELLALGTPVGSWFGCWRVDGPPAAAAAAAAAAAQEERQEAEGDGGAKKQD